MGFTFDDTETADEETSGTPIPLATRERLFRSRDASQEIVLPYIGGDEVNTDPSHLHHRYCVSLGDRSLEECEATWPAVMTLLKKKVMPDRTRKNSRGEFVLRPPLPQRWWHHADKRPALYRALSRFHRVLVIARVTEHAGITFLSAKTVFSEMLVVFASDAAAMLAVLQSRSHEIWARTQGSSLGTTLRYTPSDCFETFPFPENFETDPALEAVGNEYYEYRAALMVEHDEGLTKTYNRFHDPAESNGKILRLRELHVAMDRSVLDAYGWKDVPTACGFALDWLDLDDDELADTLASAPDDIRERIESADYFFPDAAAACRFQSHIKQSGRGKLPWRYRWPDEVRDDVLARLLALNATRAELERLTGLPGATARPDSDDNDESTAAPPAKAKRAKKASKRAAKTPKTQSMFPDEE
jgi:hypothetical protein